MSVPKMGHKIGGGFDLLALEAPNYLLIAHSTECVGELGWNFSVVQLMHQCKWGKSIARIYFL